MRTLTITLTTFLLLAANAHALNEMTLVTYYDGEGWENYFGGAIAVGDFDDDEHDEFIIGASAWNNNTGKNYYYDWNGNWPYSPTWTFQGTQEWSSYDRIDANVGDVTGDGIEDFAINETRDDFYGRLDLLFGSADFDSIADWSCEAGEPVFTIGQYADSCGDVNGDGWNDFCFHIWYNTDMVWEDWILFGGEVLDTIPDWRFPGYYYPHISGLGDVNGDNFADILVSSVNDQPPLLFFGGSPMDTIPDLVFEGVTLSGNGGGVGDVNADGYNDICLSIHLPDSVGTDGYVYFGGPNIDNIPDVILQNHFGELWGFGGDLGHGDLNGDGISDIIAGSGNPLIGDLVYVYLGSPWFNPVPDAYVTDYSVQNDFGDKVAAGDIDNDGCDELLVGAPVQLPWIAGRVYLYSGPDEWIDYGAGVEPGDLPRTPGWYTLSQNYPNPFNASTTIHFELGKASTITIAIYDLQGNIIKELISTRQMLPGGYNVSWSGRNEMRQPVASGVYVLEFQVDEFREIRKMVMIK